MKRLCVGTAVVIVLLATGCSDDSTPLSPGDPESPAFQAFEMGFGDVHGATLGMAGMSFDIIGGILEGGAPPAKPGFEAIEYTLDYNEATQFWVMDLYMDDEAGNLFTVTDSVQLLVDGVPTQYPDPEALDLVRSFLTFDASGEGGNFSGHQNLTAAPVATETGVLVTLNGSGSLNGSLNGEVADTSGVSECTLDMALTHSLTNIVVASGETGTAECPISGNVSQHGNLEIGCTGAHELSHSGNWNFSVSFIGENSFEVRAISGGNVWEYTDICD
jgi:hypothetical protein